jgi:hypothetical protein
MALEFTRKVEGLLEVFIAVHGRRPISSDEFVQWVAFYEANSRTTNSRGALSEIFKVNDDNDSSF